MGKLANLSEQVIAQIIALKESGSKTSQIAKQVGVTTRSVRRWFARFKEGGGAELPAQKKSPGMPKKTSKRSLTVIKRQLEANPRLTARKIKEMNPDIFGEVSVRTVNRRIAELGYTSHRPVKKPILSPKQKAKRVVFAKKYIAWDEVQWMSVLWSDESTFTVTCNRGANVYRKVGSDALDPRYIEGTVKHPNSLMVWGAFTGYGVAKLHIFEKNEKVNQYNYLELMCDLLPDAFEDTKATIFQQDGARPHTAKSVIQWFEDCQVNYIKDWPGNSPDISPIENLWRIVKHDLQGKDVSSVSKLEREMRASWENIPKETLRNVALSVSRRLEEVIKRKGNPTKY